MKNTVHPDFLYEMLYLFTHILESYINSNIKFWKFLFIILLIWFFLGVSITISRAAADALNKVSPRLSVPFIKLPATTISSSGVVYTDGLLHPQNFLPVEMCPRDGELKPISVYLLNDQQEGHPRNPGTVQEHAWSIAAYIAYPHHYYAHVASNQNEKTRHSASNPLWMYYTGNWTEGYLAMSERERLNWRHSS